MKVELISLRKFMVIRRFRLGDEMALFRVFFSAVHEIASRDYTGEQVNAWASADTDSELWAEHIRNLCPFVAEVDNEIVGYADIQPNGYIDHFFVSKAYARQGVGSLLMNRIHEEAGLLDIDELTANVSKTAEPFFVLQGFQAVERRFPVRGGVTLPNVLMRKKLAHGT